MGSLFILLKKTDFCHTCKLFQIQPTVVSPVPQVMGNNRQLLSLAVTANSQRHHLQEATTVHSLSMARVEDHLPMGNQTNPVVRTNLRAAMGTAKGGVQAAKVSKLLKKLASVWY